MHSLVRLLLRLLTPLLAVLGLASCIEDETKLEINGDGSGRFRIVVKISPMLASATQKVGGGHLSDIKKFTEAMFNAMPSALVRGSSGVDVWTEAAITKDDRGWQILTLAGLRLRSAEHHVNGHAFVF